MAVERLSMYTMLDFASDFLGACNTPLASEVAKAIKVDGWRGASNFKCDPHYYTKADDYYADRQVVDAFRKISTRERDPRLREEALKTWWAAERRCFQTNLRFSSLADGFAADNECVHEFITRVRKNLSRLMGRAPGIDKIKPRFSGGKTYCVEGQPTVPQKVSCLPELTAGASLFLPVFLRDQDVWVRASQDKLFCSPLDLNRFKIVKGNRYATVPKTVKTDRSIGVEPLLNLFYQLGVGGILKDRLRARGFLLSPEDRLPFPGSPGGIDLFTDDVTKHNESQTLHRDLARRASIDSTLATLDLSSASDTIAYQVVRLLVDADWFRILDALRSPFTLVDNHEVKLEKFSSMGNGFTFELETCIFASICYATAQQLGVSLVVGQNFSVFGDDIIVPVEIADAVVSYLTSFGFVINPDKSFVSGPFRESCGGDYFQGQDCVPVRFTDGDTDFLLPTQAFVVLNQLKKVMERQCPSYDNERLKILYWKIYRMLPDKAKGLFGPQRYGDSVLHSNNAEDWDTRISETRDLRRTSGLTEIRVLSAKPLTLRAMRYDSSSLVASSLYGGHSGDTVGIRGNSGLWELIWVPLRT